MRLRKRMVNNRNRASTFFEKTKVSLFEWDPATRLELSPGIPPSVEAKLAAFGRKKRWRVLSVRWLHLRFDARLLQCFE
ncbi:hypothetical protein CEXT_341581 [Caerostris extrusa]|uniref:Uncharacterized protein n=1 Tax=Caerostris extrusa TaxID=172846 RepID=A0AAV4SLP7_CAEEX|nr:hypothetical protein CEXT_341581 [Caerostris extrusa]